MRWTWLGVGGALLVACGTGENGAEPYVVRDSAGIRVAESTAPAWTPAEAWRLSAEPALTVGAVEGPAAQLLGRPVAVVLQADGGVVVADRDAGEIRWFDAAGAHLRTLGGRGSGPGEFSELYDLFRVPGDLLVAADFAGRRLTVLTTAGEVARLLDVGQPPPTGRFPDGRWFQSVSLPPEGGVQLGAQRYGSALLAVNEGGGPPDTLAVLQGMDAMHVEMNFDGRVQVMGQPFPYGRFRMSELHEGTIWTSDGTAFALAQLDPDGTVRSLVRRPGERRPVTEALRERYVADRLAAAPEAARPAVRQRMERLVFPDTMAAWQQMVVDAEGNAWARHHELPDDTVHTWSVFTPDGRWLGEVETPADLAVMAIGHGRVAGIWRDDLDVPFVHVHTLDNHPETR